MSEIFTGNNFVVNTDVVPLGEGICPLFNAEGTQLGDMKDLIRINNAINGGWPESFVDQGNGSYFRVSNNGVGYGTSVVGCPSFKTLAKFHFIPSPKRVEIDGDSDMFRIKADSIYEERNLCAADVQSTRTWHRPPEGRGNVQVDLSTTLNIKEHLPMSTATHDIGKDLFRWYMLSSMYVNDITYDSNLLRFENADGQTQEISISKIYEVNNGKRRDGHLFDKPVPLGSWLELVKTSGSTWLPRSPSIRYDIRDTHGMQLGVQGWWSGSDNPDDDNLNIWLEWIDVPKALEPDMKFSLDVGVTSMPCIDHEVEKSLPAWPKRLWWKPVDYSHRMEYDYALDKAES
jgi:hypothetical protein